jgi:CoA:oxalate CoA-transferase
LTEGLMKDIRILDLTLNLSGPYGSMLMADMGADVVKIEPPSGDPHRKLNPKHAGMSLLFAAVNRNKRSIVIDLKTERGREIALSLAAEADVVFNNFRPGVLDKLGLGYDAVAARNERVVYCCLTGYGIDGPRADFPAYDLAVQALSGGMSLTGYPGSPPARAGIPIADLGGGAYAVIAILAALARRGITGKGAYVETSLFDSQISLLMYWAALGLNTDFHPGPQGGGNSHVTPYGPMRAKDGWLVVAIYGEQFWTKLCAALGRPDLETDPRFELNPVRVENRDALQAELDSAFGEKTVAEWIAILDEHDVPSAPVNDVHAAMNDPQVAARGLLVELPIGGDTLGFAGNPIREVPVAETPRNPPPAHGEHTREVLADWLGLEGDEVAGLVGEGAIMAQEEELGATA